MWWTDYSGSDFWTTLLARAVHRVSCDHVVWYPFSTRRLILWLTSPQYTFLAKPEDGDEVGGEGGAIFTGEGSTTTFKRRTIHQDNSADNGGGALWNEGTTMLMSNGFLKGNSANVSGL